jgi:hypothetical protein
MFDFQFATVRKYDGTARTERAIEVFNAATGTTIAFCRRRPFEAKQAWIDRAFHNARMAVA